MKFLECTRWLKKNWLGLAAFALFFICIVMIVFYIRNVSNRFSTSSADWGNFGGYLGSITGLLAFAGVLYSIKQSSIAHIESSERDTFFNLLDLHKSKVSSVVYRTKIDLQLEGAEAFKKYVYITDQYFLLYFIVKYVKKTYSDISLSMMEEICTKRIDEFKLLKYVNDVYTNRPFLISGDYNTTLVNFKDLMINELKYDKYILRERIFERNDFPYYCKMKAVQQYLDDFSDAFRTNSIKVVADFIYKEYGHITGHYFRNMFYVMKTIKGFSNNEKYIGLFRAQLSRYELVLGLFNAVSSNSSKEMIDLLKEFKVFKDIYPEDITVIKILFENDKQEGETNQEKMLRITNSILDNWKPSN